MVHGSEKVGIFAFHQLEATIKICFYPALHIAEASGSIRPFSRTRASIALASRSVTFGSNGLAAYRNAMADSKFGGSLDGTDGKMPTRLNAGKHLRKEKAFAFASEALMRMAQEYMCKPSCTVRLSSAVRVILAKFPTVGSALGSANSG